MEAELFAAERGRPAPSGRALVCAANHASEIQGSSATYKLKDARNRAPVTPVSLHISDVSAQRRVWGSQEGAREPFGINVPDVSKLTADVATLKTSIPQPGDPTDNEDLTQLKKKVARIENTCYNPIPDKE